MAGPKVTINGKTVEAAPGEKISVINGVIYINDKRLPDEEQVFLNNAMHHDDPDNEIDSFVKLLFVVWGIVLAVIFWMLL
jgi:hypothetical protein